MNALYWCDRDTMFGLHVGTCEHALRRGGKAVAVLFAPGGLAPMTYKTAVLRPYKAEVKAGRGKSATYTEVPLEGVLGAVVADARSLADMVGWQLGSDPELRSTVANPAKSR